MSGARISVELEDDGTVIVVDGAGVTIARLGRETRTVRDFAALVGALRLSREQLDVLLGEGRGARFLRRMPLKIPGTCWRCGGRLDAEEVAVWHSVSKVVRHVGNCPAVETGEATSRRRAA